MLIWTYLNMTIDANMDMPQYDHKYMIDVKLDNKHAK